MAAKTRNFASRKQLRDQNLKKKNPKELFNKICHKDAEHEYIYIFEIKFENNTLFKNGGQKKGL